MKKSPAPKKEAKPDLTYVPEGELPRLFLARDSGGRWRAKDGTYSESLLRAGTFTRAEADELEANVGDQVVPLERAVQEGCRAANPMMLAAIAALGSRG
jgi:hypothetical protein